ncbi:MULTISPECIES: hypothetical protein [unclassified Imperialibacter]|uniref:hypothetical protein n=1 Tax=unclassified Imperialibacter TaxID=2629706 RepID=UPI0012597D53|nr:MULTISPECIES: hypothetical protein [unclassified Imperialibacter]CAD5246733.1 conserved exported hypothetical protein [Imperialibacter sp. 75]CAD5246796.1 conserved exported hypothetical protein [Imperialibacter sp. 89]VVS96451.1 conserved exported hypothetical protein [Imperialibacter sp. EC-SDR9]
MNNRILFYLLVASFFLSVAAPVVAQEQEAEDPFADYSYLWENTKKKKKKKDKKAEKVDQPTVAADTLTAPVPVVDTLTLPTQPLDSITPVTTYQADTIPATDSLQAPIEEEKFESEPEEEKKIKEPKEEREKREVEPVPEDFRAGPPDSESGGSFTGGVTYTKIGDENFVGLVLAPEFKIWKIGLGLNVPVLYGLESQAIRTEIFEGGIGAARLIRYIRYGSQKRDPVYVRVGELNNTMIGFGGLINNYTNTTSYEKRKLGLHYDLNFKGLFGLEGMYSDFDPASLNLLAVRPYVRPMAWTIIPIVRTLEIGATVIKDKDQTQRPTSDSTFVVNQFTADGVGAFGLDAGINLLRIPFIQIDAFVNYSRLNVGTAALTDSIATIYASQGDTREFTDGHGISGGINFRFNFIADLLSTDMRIERLTYTDNYLPQFFDASYELNKDARLLSLANAGKMSGIYGSLTGHILQKVQLGGSILLPDDVSETAPAVVRLNADVDRLGDKVSIHGSYVKGNLSTLKDAFKLDERSLVKVRFIYHLNRFLAAGVDYYWAFAPTADGSYKATQYFSPYFGVSIKF